MHAYDSGLLATFCNHVQGLIVLLCSWLCSLAEAHCTTSNAEHCFDVTGSGTRFFVVFALLCVRVKLIAELSI